MKRDRLLRALLRVSAVFLLTYFTASHWFFHRFFFHSLGITEASLDSPFVMSQLQLIGVLVLGFALLLLQISSDPERHRSTLNVILAIGVACSVIFIASVATERLPPPFLVNAAALLSLVGLVGWLRAPSRPAQS